MELELLQLLLYSVFLFSIVAYATLDGFDLGVGCLHLFAKGDNERRLMINAIGPVWDGNTTWIVIGSGVLFAAFPRAFANMMEGFYTPIMLLLFGFMLRGAAIEFRSKRKDYFWRNMWDIVFAFASLLVALDIGMMLGNLIHGLPLNAEGHIEAGMAQFLSPYPLLVAIFGVSLFVMHGSIYLLMKTEAELHEKLRRWVHRTILCFLILWIITTGATFLYKFHMVKPFFDHPSLLIFALCSFCSILAIPRAIAHKQDGWAFVASCSSIIFLLVLYLIGTFPYFVYSTINPENSLTLYNSSSTKTALLVLLIVVITGLPLSFFYGTYIHRVFRGKIKLDHMSY